MINLLLKEDIIFYQRFLKANGFYASAADGKWGAQTDAADKAFLQKAEEIKTMHGAADPRSETNIVTLVPAAQIAARKSLVIFANAGLDVRILSGTRTYAQQNLLYRKGRFGSKEAKVTNARGGQSNHNFGIAWDIGLFENGKYITEEKKYKSLAPMILNSLPETAWGGNWKKFKDLPHYQLKAITESITVLKKLFEAGKNYV